MAAQRRHSHPGGRAPRPRPEATAVVRAEVSVLRWAHGGDGVAVPEDGPWAGRVVFVPGAVPGDRLEVEAVEVKPRWLRVRILRILTPSPERVTPPCPVQMACGGCPWMVGSTAAQARSREAILRGEITKRLGRPDVPVTLRPTPGAFSYRQRARFTVRPDPDGRMRAGFMGAASHAFVAAERCAIVRPAITDALPALLTALPRAFDGRITVLSGAPLDAPATPGPTTEAVAAWAEPRGGAPFPLGPGRVMVPFGPFRQPMAPAAFAQANPEVTAQILADVARALEVAVSDVASPHAAELFAGSGTLTHALWSAGCTVDAWEVDEDARVAFTEAAGRAAESGASSASDSRWSACDLLATGLVTPPPRRPPDVILLDPPRTGARELMPWLRRQPARLMLYLACDLAAALRDLQDLLTPRDADPTPPWRLDHAISYDMFPHSGHQEVLFVLTRAP